MPSGYEVLATFLLIVSLSQDAATPTPFLWMIEGMGDAKSLTLVTISLTPHGLGNRIEVETISLDPLPTADDPKPREIPLKTEPAPGRGLRGRGLRAWFTPPGRRFHLIVTLSDGSTHVIDIYRTAPPSEPKVQTAPTNRGEMDDATVSLPIRWRLRLAGPDIGRDLTSATCRTV